MVRGQWAPHRHVPKDLTEEELFSIMEPFGMVERVEVATEKPVPQAIVEVCVASSAVVQPASSPPACLGRYRVTGGGTGPVCFDIQ